MKQQLEIDKGLNSMKVPLSLSELYERYNRTPPDPEQPGDALEPAQQQGPPGMGGDVQDGQDNPILAALGGGDGGEEGGVPE